MPPKATSCAAALIPALLEQTQGRGGERARAASGGSHGDGVREGGWTGLRVAVGGGHVRRATRRAPARKGAGLGARMIEEG